MRRFSDDPEVPPARPLHDGPPPFDGRVHKDSIAQLVEQEHRCEESSYSGIRHAVFGGEEPLLVIQDSNGPRVLQVHIKFCPFCGKKLTRGTPAQQIREELRKTRARLRGE